jgi:glycosyltransferase involved in cell wall biosynthesis
VLPSRSEGIPNIALEAMALGKPVVATRVGGIPDIITDGEEGLLVSPEDPPSLARALRRVLDDEALAGRLGGRGRDRVRKSFTPAARAAAVLSLYRELLGDGRLGSGMAS